MNPTFRSIFLFLAILPMVFLVTPSADASKPIAYIYSFHGEVIVQSGTEILMLTEPGFSLKDGDMIQTKQGTATINFDDGAVMRINPFSNIAIKQREEKHGFWIFKEMRPVRRITCFVGKLWFKSGVSKRKNFLQTPTAVCGVRGSEVESGYNNIDSLLNVITGAADKLGPWLEGAFADPGAGTAFTSTVYQAIAKAHEAMERANATGQAIDFAQARVEIWTAIMEAAIELQRNPDPDVSREAQVWANVAAANIAAAEAEVSVEQLVEAGASDSDIQDAQDAADSAQEQADAALEAANGIYDEEGVLDPERLDDAIRETAAAAQSAQEFAEQAAAIAGEAAPPEEPVPEEVVPPKEPAPEEAVPEEEAPPEEIPPPEEVPVPGTETTEQEVYQQEASPSQ